ncbi:alpha/beta hydrolase fold protein [Stanieria cyanosphaera PCC 7437]|uniref:Alpha/beta hydrolase fold protein n=1 Tax=Stanieria cyanosphaera (strain ATCC 29371 / PCC 7437) TaxID=111780 RepID=K9XR38_STAC7|nr:alpha/beta fold hydrolase [Stanieria cyanosphaera]AFZ34117.1 alpha/beta hydrolase fold protein [Stanieria cyanosphaera PCC 7437]
MFNSQRQNQKQFSTTKLSNYLPPRSLQNGLLMTLYVAFRANKIWQKNIIETEPFYQEKIFLGAQEVPIYGLVAIPKQAKGTIIGTYGITGDLDNQWFLRILGRKAYARGYAVVLFDWRGHGKTASLSPTLTSDGLYEGEDFVKIAGAAKEMGCPAPFWFTGYSLGGQLALWGIKSALNHPDLAGGAVICPSLDSNRSLTYLEQHPVGKYVEQKIAQSLKQLALKLHSYHPNDFDLAAINRANSIRCFDHELVINRLGFSSTEEYYEACNALYLLPQLTKPTLILYAEDDPLFNPAIIPDLKQACDHNRAIDLILTKYGGHVGYISNQTCQQNYGDRDCWWAWNRVLDWCDQTDFN